MMRLLLRAWRPATCALGVLCAHVEAQAQAADDYLEVVQEQLDDDVTPLPAGMGALFVPSLTDPTLEPSVIVLYDGDRVASGRTSERIVLPPGRYQVVVGNGALAGRAVSDVRVLDGLTSPVTPFFGAVRVRIVGPQGRAADEQYVLVSADGSTVLRSNQLAAGQETWLLTPGRYLLVLGTRPDAKRNTLPILVGAGDVAAYELTVDEGRLVRSDFADEYADTAAPGPWRVEWVLGGSGTLVQRRHQLSGLDGEAVLVEGSTHFEGGLDTGAHLAMLSLSTEQSLVALEGNYGASVPLRPLTNEAEAEIVYNYRPGRIAGPYARVLARTSFMADDYFADDAVTATIHDDDDGSVLRQEDVAADGELRLFDPLRPVTVQEGAGLALTFIDSPRLSLMLRAGPAARQAYYDNGLVITSEDAGGLDLVELDDNDRLGGELTGMGSVRLVDALVLRSRFDSFIPHEQLIDGEQLRPVFRWDTSLTVRLTQIVYFGYSFRLSRDELALEDLQTAQSAALRLTYTIF